MLSVKKHYKILTLNAKGDLQLPHAHIGKFPLKVPFFSNIEGKNEPIVVAHTSAFCTWETEAGGLL